MHREIGQRESIICNLNDDCGGIGAVALNRLGLGVGDGDFLVLARITAKRTVHIAQVEIQTVRHGIIGAVCLDFCEAGVKFPAVGGEPVCGGDSGGVGGHRHGGAPGPGTDHPRCGCEPHRDIGQGIVELIGDHRHNFKGDAVLGAGAPHSAVNRGGIVAHRGVARLPDSASRCAGRKRDIMRLPGRNVDERGHADNSGAIKNGASDFCHAGQIPRLEPDGGFAVGGVNRVGDHPVARRRGLQPRTGIAGVHRIRRAGVHKCEGVNLKNNRCAVAHGIPEAVVYPCGYRGLVPQSRAAAVDVVEIGIEAFGGCQFGVDDDFCAD